MMTRLCSIFVSMMGVVATGHAQDSTLAGTIGVFVFPADGQSAAEQSRDEADCYRWATDRTGTDPFSLARQAERQTATAERAAAQAQQAGRGAAAGGAATGAATGALVGAAFGSSKKTRQQMAATGALIGGASGSAQRQQAQAQAQSAANRAAGGAANTEAQIDRFKTAFATCLEGNNYIAKF